MQVIYPIVIYLPIYIQAEKERLLYDMQQRRGLDEDGERNAIRRGLRAGPSHDTSEATSLPPSLPPGPPSSTSSGSSTSVALCLSGTNWEAVARLWHARNPGWGCSAVAQTALAVPATAKASSTQGVEQLAPKELTAAEALADMAMEEDATVAHQSGCASSHSATQGLKQPGMFAPDHTTARWPCGWNNPTQAMYTGMVLVQASQTCSSSSEGEPSPGAGLGVELHQQGTKRLHQTGCWSPAEAASEGAQQRIEEGPAAASPCSSLCSPHLLGFGKDPSELYLLFAKLFTPKHPSKLPRSRWLSCN